MLRGFRHTLFLLLQLGILVSGVAAVVLDPRSWPAVLICVGGSVVTSLLCERFAAKYLRSTLGRLRRLADDVGAGAPVRPLEVHPGDDFYKLISAINLVSLRLAEATAQKERLNEQLRQSEKLAVLGELAASVAHEINNPLDGVQNCARILRRSLADGPRVGQMLNLIDDGLERIELIVRGLLTLARQHVIRPRRTDLCDVVDAALNSARADLMRSTVRVVREFESRPAAAAVDPLLLEQAFVNLIRNAADSMPRGGTLTVAIRRAKREPAGEWRVEFEDTGCGIAPHDLPHIFEPFFTTKTGGKGTGLGLSIAARIIDAHQGSISVASRREGGTTFSVCIPCPAAAPVADARDVGGAPASRAEPVHAEPTPEPAV